MCITKIRTQQTTRKVILEYFLERRIGQTKYEKEKKKI